MAEIGRRQTPFLAPFLEQIRALGTWLDSALTEAGITGTPCRRALRRIEEFEDEVREVFFLIVLEAPSGEISKLTTYEEFDASKLFNRPLANRADAGIQDLGAGIQDELVALARRRKKELETSIVKGKAPDVQTLSVWRAMSACDYIEEVGSTVLRLAESARYLFQTEFLLSGALSYERGKSNAGAGTRSAADTPAAAPTTASERTPPGS